jgi:hypothetical protein
VYLTIISEDIAPYEIPSDLMESSQYCLDERIPILGVNGTIYYLSPPNCNGFPPKWNSTCSNTGFWEINPVDFTNTMISNMSITINGSVFLTTNVTLQQGNLSVLGNLTLAGSDLNIFEGSLNVSESVSGVANLAIRRVVQTLIFIGGCLDLKGSLVVHFPEGSNEKSSMEIAKYSCLGNSSLTLFEAFDSKGEKLPCAQLDYGKSSLQVVFGSTICQLSSALRLRFSPMILIVLWGVLSNFL